MKNTIVDISRPELLRMEESLCANLSGFLSFSGHAIYFPPEEEKEAVWLPQERKILLPLWWRERFLGTLVLSGARNRNLRSLLPLLPNLATTCLAIEALKLLGRRDSLTALANEEYFYSSLQNELETIRGMREDIPVIAAPERGFYRLCIGLIILQWGDAEEAANSFGPEFCQNVFGQLAGRLAEIFPENTLVAPLGRFDGRHEFGIVVAASGTIACAARAKELLDKLAGFRVQEPRTGKFYMPRLYAGFALYPHDIQGEETLLPIWEQVDRLRNRARLAVAHAVELAGVTVAERILGYAELPARGGLIEECLPDGSLRLNLGLSAQVGLDAKFDVYGIGENGQEIKKGQLQIIAAYKDFSFGKMAYFSAAEMPVRGDRLRLAHDVGKTAHALEMGGASDSWLDYSGFSRELSGLAGGFGLGLAQTRPADEDGGDFPANLEKLLAVIDELVPSPAFRGKLGNGVLVFCHVGQNKMALAAFYEKLATLATENSMKLQAGIFVWPYLHYGKGEAEVCVHKALECAKLLPEPQVSFFDSVALTVNADKLYSVGNIMEAIREYEAAILADASNAMALNSLGVALASLGKLDEAKRQLLKALKTTPAAETAGQICYNLGAVHQQANNNNAARAFYKKAVQHNPAHAWAWMRLAQISAARGRKLEATKLLEKAMEAAQGDERIINAARRQLAKITIKRDKTGEAREILHDNLIARPDDLASILELARLYLANSEDPAMAELLAGRALEMGGGRVARDLLAQALEKQGKFAEARAILQTGI